MEKMEILCIMSEQFPFVAQPAKIHFPRLNPIDLPRHRKLTILFLFVRKIVYPNMAFAQNSWVVNSNEFLRQEVNNENA